MTVTETLTVTVTEAETVKVTFTETESFINPWPGLFKIKLNTKILIWEKFTIFQHVVREPT